MYNSISSSFRDLKVRSRIYLYGGRIEKTRDNKFYFISFNLM